MSVSCIVRELDDGVGIICRSFQSESTFETAGWNGLRCFDLSGHFEFSIRRTGSHANEPVAIHREGAVGRVDFYVERRSFVPAITDAAPLELEISAIEYNIGTLQSIRFVHPDSRCYVTVSYRSVRYFETSGRIRTDSYGTSRDSERRQFSV